MKIRLLLATASALALAACGGGGSGTSAGAGGVGLVPLAPAGSARATATITLKIPTIAPTSISTSSSARRPLFLSPGTDKISFIDNGAAVITDAPVANYSNANGGTGVFTYANGQSATLGAALTPGQQYFTVTLTISVLPGQHTYGVVMKSGTPAYVLSEGTKTYDLKPGANDLSGSPLVLSGVVATGYISCDTDGQNLAANNPPGSGTCASYSNFTQTGSTYSYAFTAVAADFDGFPIAYQSDVLFDNGAFSVVEDSSDGSPVVSINQSGAPWAYPGNHLSGPVLGDWSSSSKTGHVQYGQPFSVTCLRTGVANLQLQLNANGGTFAAKPSGSPDGGAYPPAAVANGLLPIGRSDASQPPRVNNVAVQCTSTGTISVI